MFLFTNNLSISLSFIYLFLQLMHTTIQTLSFWNQKTISTKMLDQLLLLPYLWVIVYLLQMWAILELLFAGVAQVRLRRFDSYLAFGSFSEYFTPKVWCILVYNICVRATSKVCYDFGIPRYLVVVVLNMLQVILIKFYFSNYSVLTLWGPAL